MFFLPVLHSPHDSANTSTSSTEVKVLLFAALKDAAQSSSVQVRCSSPASVADLLTACEQQIPALAPYLPYVRVAVNFEYSNGEQTISPGDEIAFLPPVSGGSLGDSVEVISPLVAITHQAIDPEEVARSAEECLGGGAGAVLTFEGIVRNNAQGHLVNFLEYYGYEEMARRTLGQVSEEVRARWDLPCALVHRLGRLEIGEASVVIAVASPHRAQAFEACRYAIDRIKEIVPIWKKETAQDGSWWVENPLDTIEPKVMSPGATAANAT
ncbi:MAG TPA: molybdenum cofactor biosynthesis protein MoaE [Abditibacteriaceae bacterium]|nr:molybdenum cofactor biosynthesis protein MoaE [Abditibacteriaceae bacterium]